MPKSSKALFLSDVFTESRQASSTTDSTSPAFWPVTTYSLEAKSMGWKDTAGQQRSKQPWGQTHMHLYAIQWHRKCPHAFASIIERTIAEKGGEQESSLIHSSFKESSGVNLTAIWIGCKPPEMPSAQKAVMPSIQNVCWSLTLCDQAFYQRLNINIHNTSKASGFQWGESSCCRSIDQCCISKVVWNSKHSWESNN